MHQTTPFTQSLYFAGLQCPKQLWHLIHTPEFVPEPDAAYLAYFDQTEPVVRLAMQRYSDGIDLTSISERAHALTETKSASQQRRPIFGAAAATAYSYARTDILLPVRDDEWNLILIKCSSSVKANHKANLAFQYDTFSRAGYRIRDCFVLLLNTNYIRENELDLNQLFIETNVTREVFELQSAVEANLGRLNQVLELPESPKIAIGKHCRIPGQCRIHRQCWNFLPRDNIFTLVRAGDRAYKWLADGISDLREIPLKAKLSKLQQIQLDAIRSEEVHVEPEPISQFLKKLKYPRYYLDFETASPAIPPFPGLSPFQTIPFQFSLHIDRSPDDTLEHRNFLADGTCDPRPELLARLQEWLGSTGSIIAYNAPFEIGVLNTASTQYNQYRPWFEKLRRRFVDLLIPFRSFHYYHPAQRGSASIKSVLPAMTGRSYSELEIGNGEFASLEYVRTHYFTVDPAEKARVRADLLAYCGLDTEAMILLVKQLEAFVPSEPNGTN